MQNNVIEYEVSGEKALFSDIILRVGGEKCSYQIPTYEALRGMTESIYWKPTFEWIIDDVRIMNKISTVSRNVRTLGIDGKADRSIYMYLSNVRYQVRAHMEWNMNRPQLAHDRDLKKHMSIANRALLAGGRRTVFLGTKECLAEIAPCHFGEGEGYYDGQSMNFGLMYHGITYADNAVNEEDKESLTTRFWVPVMKDGVIHYERPEACLMKRKVRPDAMTPFVDKKNFIGLAEFPDGYGIEDIWSVVEGRKEKHVLGT